MASVAEATPTHVVVESTPAADPAPLGLGAFALTTFMLSGHNASFIPDLIWVGCALFYGGLTQLLAGMWEFRNRNVFGATAFSTYGGFWMAFGIFVVLAEDSKSFGAAVGSNAPNAGAWFLIAFAIFNTYMLLWATQVNVGVFLVFLTLEATEIILAIGNFDAAHNGNANNCWTHLGGWVGIATAGVAWYVSAAGVINGMKGRHVVPVGAPLHLGNGHVHRRHQPA